MPRRRKKEPRTTVRVLCAACHQFFETPAQCLECSNWNTCLSCLEQEGQEIEKALAVRGITLPGRTPNKETA